MRNREQEARLHAAKFVPIRDDLRFKSMAKYHALKDGDVL